MTLNKSTFVCFFTICLVMFVLSSCGEVKNFTYDIVPQSTDEPSGTMETNIDMDEDSIGGNNMGDELLSPYGIFDHIQYIAGTFVESATTYVAQYAKLFPDDTPDRPSVLYYVAQAMDLTQEDLEIYFKELGIADQITDNMYKGLLTDDLSESMQLLKTPYAFYKDGKLYTIYNLYASKNTEEVKAFVEQEEYANTWKAIQEYLEIDGGYEYSSNLISYAYECALENIRLNSISRD
ncbi:MAG: hypothetical protein HFE63_07915 [Clostridiales bacterium]|nr:hypothetical protein [Clostridiales bacterium]